MIYAFVEKIIVHAPEKIDGERHMQIDIYLKFIGNFQVPQDEPTAEEMAEEALKKHEIIQMDLKEGIPSRDVCMIYDAKRPMSAAAQKLKKLLQEEKMAMDIE